jgi:hypothetical protein
MATVITQNGALTLANSLVGKYLALIRQDGTEVDGVNYERQVVPSLTITSDTTNHYITNSEDIIFSIAGSDWATVTNIISKVGIYNNATAGNLLILADLTVAKPCYQGDQIKILKGNLKITIPQTTT